MLLMSSFMWNINIITSLKDLKIYELILLCVNLVVFAYVQNIQ